MSFDWAERLELAFDLVGQPAHTISVQARQRAAISNAYYAAYKSASNFLRDHDGIVIPTLDAHWFVIHEFRQSRQRVRQQKQIGRDLDQLRRVRNQADYDDVVADLLQKTADTLVTARDIVERLNTL